MTFQVFIQDYVYEIEIILDCEIINIINFLYGL